MKHRDTLEVQRVPGIALKGADAPLAEDHIFISGSHDILRGHDPFVIGGVQAPLEKDGAVHLA